MEAVLGTNPWLIGILFAWSVPWKGVALWKAARRGEPWWFIGLLVVNTFGIFEILYIFVLTKYVIRAKKDAPHTTAIS